MNSTLLLPDAILAGRSRTGTNSLPGVWTRDQRFQPHRPTYTPPSVHVETLLDPSSPTILIPSLGFSSWFPGRWYQLSTYAAYLLPAPCHLPFALLNKLSKAQLAI